MNPFKVVPSFIPTQSATIEVLWFLFMKPLNGKENTQSDFWNSWGHEQILGGIKKRSNKGTDRVTERDSERQAKNDQMLLQLMQSMIMNNNQAGNRVFQQTTHSEQPVSMAMSSDFSKEHPSYPDTPVFNKQCQEMSRYHFFPKYSRVFFKQASWLLFSSGCKRPKSLDVHGLEKEIRSELWGSP